MSADFLCGMDLEQRCVRPGEWLIEGYTVVRWARGRWDVYETGGEGKTTVGTLREARELIANTDTGGAR